MNKLALQLICNATRIDKHNNDNNNNNSNNNNNDNDNNK